MATVITCRYCRFWTPPAQEDADPRGQCILASHPQIHLYREVPPEAPLAARFGPDSQDGVTGQVRTRPDFSCALAQFPDCDHGPDCGGNGPDCAPVQPADSPSYPTSASPQDSPEKKKRPRTLESTTTLLKTEHGNLYVTVSTGSDGQPFEVFGALGKAGGLEHGMTELVARLISLHLRRHTPLEEIIEQCEGIQEMQPWPNRIPGDDDTVFILGLGDGIAHVLKRLATIRQATQRRPQEASTPDNVQPDETS